MLTHTAESDAIMHDMVASEPWTQDKKRCAELVDAIEHCASRNADAALGAIATRDKQNALEVQLAQSRRRKAMQNVVVPADEEALRELKPQVNACCDLLVAARTADERTLRQSAEDFCSRLERGAGMDRREMLDELLTGSRAEAFVPCKGDGDPYGEGLVAVSRIVGHGWQVKSLDLEPVAWRELQRQLKSEWKPNTKKPGGLAPSLRVLEIGLRGRN